MVMDNVPIRKIGTYPAVISMGDFSSPVKKGSDAVAEENKAKWVIVPQSADGRIP